MPSKKIVSVFLLTGALVFSIIIAFGKDRSSQTINFANNLVAGDKVLVPENPDWQSELGKIEKTSSGAAKTAATTPNGKETVTDTVSQSLISNYLALKQSDALDQTSAQKLIDQSLNYVSETSNEITFISKLNTTADLGTASMTEYGEKLGTIFKINRPQTIRNEMELVTEAVQTKDASKLNELDGIILVYEKLQNDLVAMPVPKTFTTAHVSMVNGVFAMAESLKEVKNILNDPIKGLAAMQLYQRGYLMFTEAFKATGAFLTQNGIVYKQGSGGYYLLYGL